MAERDEFREMLDGMVLDGLMEHVGVGEDGQPLYALTQEGSARAEHLIHNTVEGADLWTQLRDRFDKRSPLGEMES